MTAAIENSNNSVLENSNNSVLSMVTEAEAIFRRVDCDRRRDAMLIRLGMAIGDERGYRRGESDEAGLWSWALGIARRHALMVTHAELVRRRADDCQKPCPVHCGRCSRCVRSDAVRRQGGDYPGDGGR